MPLLTSIVDVDSENEVFDYKVVLVLLGIIQSAHNLSTALWHMICLISGAPKVSKFVSFKLQ